MILFLFLFNILTCMRFIAVVYVNIILILPYYFVTDETVKYKWNKISNIDKTKSLFILFFVHSRWQCERNGEEKQPLTEPGRKSHQGWIHSIAICNIAKYLSLETLMQSLFYAICFNYRGFCVTAFLFLFQITRVIMTSQKILILYYMIMIVYVSQKICHFLTGS